MRENLNELLALIGLSIFAGIMVIVILTFLCGCAHVSNQVNIAPGSQNVGDDTESTDAKVDTTIPLEI